MNNIENNMPILVAVTSSSERIKAKEAKEAKEVSAVNVSSSKFEEDKSESDSNNSSKLNGVVSELNNLAQNLQRDLQFSIDDKSGESFVTVRDTETKEVIREIPSKELRDLKERLEETAGIIFKDSV